MIIFFLIYICSFNYLLTEPLNIEINKNNKFDNFFPNEIEKMSNILLKNINNYRLNQDFKSLKIQLKIIMSFYKWKFCNNKLFISTLPSEKNIKIKYTNLIKFLSNKLPSEYLENQLSFNNLLIENLEEYLLLVIKFQILDQLLNALNISTEDNHIEHIYNKEQYQNQINFIANKIFEKLDPIYLESQIKNLFITMPVVFIKATSENYLFIIKFLMEQNFNEFIIDNLNGYDIKDFYENIVNCFEIKSVQSEKIEFEKKILNFEKDIDKLFFLKYYENKNNNIFIMVKKNNQWINDPNFLNTFNYQDNVEIYIAQKRIYKINNNLHWNPLENKELDKKVLKKIIIALIINEIEDHIYNIMNNKKITTIKIEGKKIFNDYYIFSLLFIKNKEQNINSSIFIHDFLKILKENIHN